MPPPTSARTFDQNRDQTVTSQREPIYSDFQLPEIADLKMLRRGPQYQAQNLEQQPVKQDYRPQARSREPEYDYEATYAQPDTLGGYSNWTSGMGYGMATKPVATGYRRVRR